jgi:16S rRNA (uracil1498-N3)-methyltransferase
VERRDRSSVATFYAEESLTSGATVDLPEGAAQHVRVRRLAVGDALQLTNGRGFIASGRLIRLTKTGATVEVDEVTSIDRPPALRLFVPVADRERMLWLAEKSAELAISSWHPILFRRSASVSPRGEGDAFGRKVRARMISAIEQSGGAWLPDIHDELPLETALVRVPSEPGRERFLMEGSGSLLATHRPHAADAMIGPEGGLEAAERALIVDEHHWVAASLGETTLRFETAGVVAAGILRSLLASNSNGGERG